MRDFAELVDRVQRGPGRAYMASAQRLDAPGRPVGGVAGPLPVSPVRIRREDRAAILTSFAGKTPPHDSAFTPSA